MEETRTRETWDERDEDEGDVEMEKTRTTKTRRNFEVAGEPKIERTDDWGKGTR